MATPEDLFTATLQRHADTVEAPTRRFGQEAYQAAGRVRRRRRITAAIGTAAVVAAAVPVGLGLVDPRVPNESIQPTQSQAPPKTVTIDVGALPRGSAPAVPWYFDGNVNIGDKSFPVGHLRGGQKLDQLSTAGDGFILSEGCCYEVPSKLETRIFDRDGKLVRTVPGGRAVVSADGRTIVSVLRNTGDSTFIATDSASGAEIGRTSVPDPYVEPAGFVGDRVVYSFAESRGDRPEITAAWNPRSGAVTSLSGLSDVMLAGGGSRVATLASCKPASAAACQLVVDISDPKKELWFGELGVISFSPDGRYAVAQARKGSEAAELLVYDLVERRLALRLQSGYFAPQAAWEPDGRLLMVVEESPQGNRKETILRCSLDGECERASETVAIETGVDPTHQLPKQG